MPKISSFPSLPTVQRFDVGCEGELIHDFPTAAEALEFARWSAEVTQCSHEIFAAGTQSLLCIVDPLKVA